MGCSNRAEASAQVHDVGTANNAQQYITMFTLQKYRDITNRIDEDLQQA